MIVFLQSVIQNIESQDLKLIPWQEFKKTIFDIFEHRVKNSEEIDGNINSSSMTLDEHLLIF